MGCGSSASTGGIRHFRALYLFFKVARRYQKVQKQQNKVIAEHEDLEYAQLKLEAGSVAELPDYDAELQAIAQPAHEYGSDLFLQFALKERALWVKVSQVLATREDIAPEPYTRKLKQCQDEMPASSIKVIRRIITEEFKKPTNEVFASFETECMASASIAQVHTTGVRLPHRSTEPAHV